MERKVMERKYYILISTCVCTQLGIYIRIRVDVLNCFFEMISLIFPKLCWSWKRSPYSVQQMGGKHVYFALRAWNKTPYPFKELKEDDLNCGIDAWCPKTRPQSNRRQLCIVSLRPLRSDFWWSWVFMALLVGFGVLQHTMRKKFI